MRLDLKIDTNFNYDNRNIKIQNLIFDIFYKKNNYFYSLLALLIYHKIYNKKFKLSSYQKRKIKNANNKRYKNYKKYNLDFFFKIFFEILKITKNKIIFLTNNIIFEKKHNIYNSDQEIYNKNKFYKNIKISTIIYKYENLVIKQYKISNLYDNYAIVSIINEVILQLYSIYLLKKYKNKRYFIIPKILNIYRKKYIDSTDEDINIIMEYINLKNKLYKNIHRNEIKIYYITRDFFIYLKKNNLYHNDTHNNNLIILNNKIVLIDFGKATLFHSFNPSITGFPKLKKLKNYNQNLRFYIKKYIKILINKYRKNINSKINNDIKYYFDLF